MFCPYITVPLFLPCLKGIFILLVLMGNCVKIQETDLRLHWIFPLTSGHKKGKLWKRVIFCQEEYGSKCWNHPDSSISEVSQGEKRGQTSWKLHTHTSHTCIHIQSIKENRKENLERNLANLSSGRWIIPRIFIETTDTPF